ncbi:hypothetical protein LOAG_05455 [Loa loa]|uniref:Uncharacterized protein n=1 Tax=Loa loa TaxID=7209 RepID=A0A1S0U1S5_LOALO|nr:hypothetical protein LOAG_05455 [Loa loa]EFO23030.1 hypothetical protein LOAG_05455 [Loa loa]
MAFAEYYEGTCEYWKLVHALQQLSLMHDPNLLIMLAEKKKPTCIIFTNSRQNSDLHSKHMCDDTFSISRGRFCLGLTEGEPTMTAQCHGSSLLKELLKISETKSQTLRTRRAPASKKHVGKTVWYCYEEIV